MLLERENELGIHILNLLNIYSFDTLYRYAYTARVIQSENTESNC